MSAKIELSNTEARKFLKNINKNKLNVRRKESQVKNKLSDLNNYLFEQLERLNDDDLSDEQVEREIKKSKAVTDIARTIIDNARVELNAIQFLDDRGYEVNNRALLVFGEKDESSKLGDIDAN